LVRSVSQTTVFTDEPRVEVGGGTYEPAKTKKTTERQGDERYDLVLDLRLLLRHTVFSVFPTAGDYRILVMDINMRAHIFISQTEGGGIDITAVKHGLSFGAARKYDAVEKAKAVLLTLGFDPALVDHQLRILSQKPTSVLVRFPVAEIADDVLGSLGFKAAAFMAA
jgi:hypothetical protein